MTERGNPRHCSHAAWVREVGDAKQTIGHALRLGVSELFLHLDVDADLAPAREFARQASANGIALAVVGDDPQWLLDTSAALRWRDWVLASGVARRIHLGVQPQAGSCWPGGVCWPHQRLVAGYVTLLQSLAGTGPAPEVDVVPGWSSVAGVQRGTLAEEVLSHAGAITIRTLHADPEAAFNYSREILMWTDANRSSGFPHRVRIGLDLRPRRAPGKPDFADTESVTRAGERLAAIAARNPSFAGIAVDNLEIWAQLPAGDSAPRPPLTEEYK